MFDDNLVYFLPIIVLQLGLQIFALVNLSKRNKVKFNNKKIWVAIIIFGSLFGPIIYFLYRGEDDDYSSED